MENRERMIERRKLARVFKPHMFSGDYDRAVYQLAVADFQDGTRKTRPPHPEDPEPKAEKPCIKCGHKHAYGVCREHLYDVWGVYDCMCPEHVTE